MPEEMQELESKWTLNHEQLYMMLTKDMPYGNHTFEIDCDDYTLVLKRPKSKGSQDMCMPSMVDVTIEKN